MTEMFKEQLLGKLEGFDKMDKMLDELKDFKNGLLEEMGAE